MIEVSQGIVDPRHFGFHPGRGLGRADNGLPVARARLVESAHATPRVGARHGEEDEVVGVFRSRGEVRRPLRFAARFFTLPEPRVNLLRLM